MKKITFLFVYFYSTLLFSQDISLYKQFNGKVDFTMIGNTLNLIENEASSDCDILTSATSTLNLAPSDEIEAAYLYWAGSGDGDFEISLNGENLTAERTFSTSISSLSFFSAFFDVTNQVKNTGNGSYTFSDLDLTSIISDYCANGLNFGGWAMIIVYSNETLPINQVNIYDGMQNLRPNNVTIHLDNLYVIDNTDAKIGFLAWEGDSALSVTETLKVNGNIVGNPPLNPFDNAFNSTNSFTGESNLFNMDLDFYNIEDYISIGDTTATIDLTSGQDFVMINSVVTKLNTQIPDAIIDLNTYQIEDCNERLISIDYTVSNLAIATNPLPEVPVSFYAQDTSGTYYIATAHTNQSVAIGSSINLSMELQIPIDVTNDFTLIAKVDIDENNYSTVLELSETNNNDDFQVLLPNLPPINSIEPLIACNAGFEKNIFNLEEIAGSINNSEDVSFTYFEKEEDIIQDMEITLPSQYENITNPQNMFVKVTHGITGCYSIQPIQLQVENCPPTIPNALVANTLLEIESLYDIFTDFEMLIFNRYGDIVFQGDNSKKWDGTNKGKPLPSATYFYSIQLNDNYFKELHGWIYLVK